jgi:hypothetical protein
VLEMGTLGFDGGGGWKPAYGSASEVIQRKRGVKCIGRTYGVLLQSSTRLLEGEEEVRMPRVRRPQVRLDRRC